MARRGLEKEQIYTTKLLILTSVIALVVILAVNQNLVSGSITGATAYGGGEAVGLMILIISVICAMIFLRKKNMRHRRRRY